MLDCYYEEEAFFWDKHTWGSQPRGPGACSSCCEREGPDTLTNFALDGKVFTRNNQEIYCGPLTPKPELEIWVRIGDPSF
jgi:hypothetical protein